MAFKNMSYVLEHFLEKLPEEWIRMSHKKKKRQFEEPLVSSSVCYK